MSASVDAAADLLYGAPLSGFVDERKRLAAELRAGGDKAAAAAFLKLPRPSLSAWVVNRLHREAADEMAELLAVGDRMRGGDLSQAATQRAILSLLRARAADVLRGDGHAAGEPTLRRVATTLQALSAIGSYAPDEPGRLVADRDPPGFEVLAGSVAPPVRHVGQPAAAAPPKGRAVLTSVPMPPAEAEGEGASRADKAAARFKAVEVGRAETERVAREKEAERAAARAAAARAVREREAARARAEAEACARDVARLQEELRRAEAELEAAEERAERTARAVDGDGAEGNAGEDGKSS